MFIGGLLPAALMALCLMMLIYARARRVGTPREPRASWSQMTRAGLGAILPLLMPAMLLGGILFGVATPTEVAAFAVLYGLALAILLYREMNLAALARTILDTTALTGVLLFIFAAASGFSWTLTVAYLPQRLVALLHTIGGSTEIFMVGSILLLVIVGVLLEGLPSLNACRRRLLRLLCYYALRCGAGFASDAAIPDRCALGAIAGRVLALGGAGAAPLLRLSGIEKTGGRRGKHEPQDYSQGRGRRRIVGVGAICVVACRAAHHAFCSFRRRRSSLQCRCQAIRGARRQPYRRRDQDQHFS
jgi:hypothetical protein